MSADGEEQEQPPQAGAKTKRLPREVKTRLAKVARLAVCATETYHSLVYGLQSCLHIVTYYGQINVHQFVFFYLFLHYYNFVRFLYSVLHVFVGAMKGLNLMFRTSHICSSS